MQGSKMPSFFPAGFVKFFLSPAGLSCLSGLLLFLSYPKANLGFLGWVALAPLAFAVLSSKNLTKASLCGFLCGLVFNLGLLYWIYYTCRAGGVGQAVSILAWVALSGLLALELLVFAWIAKLVSKAGPEFAFASACAYTALEWGKTVLAAKAAWFPWFMLGYTQWRYPAVIQTASLTGAAGISFALAFSGLSLGYALKMRRPVFNKIMAVVPALILACGMFYYGNHRLKNSNPAHDASIKISLLQPNIDQYKKWDERYSGWIKSRLAGIIKKAAENSPQLVIWPESSVPGWIEEDDHFFWLAGAAQNMRAFHLAGAVSSGEGANHVSAFLFSPYGRLEAVYNKRQLVPFGEYVPMRDFLSRKVEVLGQMGEFTPGDAKQRLMTADGVKMGIAICYESVFPELARADTLSGADFLVNMTNDGWYLDTAGPYQHLAPNIFRAVENKRPLVRAANTGISVRIDEYGRVKQKLDLNSCGTMDFDLPVKKDAPKTFYTRYGEWFAKVCSAAAGIFLIATLIF